MDRIAPRLIHRAAKRGRDPEHGGYSVVIIDPIYKVLVGDENSASDMGAFCNQFDLVCAELGCSVVYCHHHSKGYQGAKHSVDRMSGSGVFARDPDAILDMTPLAATSEELKAAREGMAMAEIRHTLDERGVRYPEYREPGPFSVWAYDHLYREDTDELNARLRTLVEGTPRVTAWRISLTLREFEGAPPMDVWFDHPLHVPDLKGLLASCPYDGDARSNDGSGRTRAQAREDRLRDLALAFDAVAMGGDATTVAELAEYLDVSERTARRHVDEHPDFERVRGEVRRAS